MAKYFVLRCLPATKQKTESQEKKSRTDVSLFTACIVSAVLYFTLYKVILDGLL